jgi:hypothetical protein
MATSYDESTWVLTSYLIANVGKSVSRYVCDILASNGQLVAQVASTVMRLRGEKASGR